MFDDRPNTPEKVAERWIYLKSEWQYRKDMKEWRDILMGFIVTVVSIAGGVFALSICL